MVTLAHNVIILATLADCPQPDSVDSPGAEFLIAVADAVEDAIDNNDELDERLISEIANDAPAVSTHAKWLQFVDLRGYRVDTTDLTGDRISARALTDHINTVLVMIAERLIAGLITERRETVQNYVESNSDGEA